MQLFRPCYVFLAAIFLAARGLDAQDPPLRPIMSYLGDGATLSDWRYALRRCAALYSILGIKTRERGDSAAAAALDENGMDFLLLAKRADVAMGLPEDSAMSVAASAVVDVGAILAERMRRNMALSGSYWGSDSLLTSDMATCRRIGEDNFDRLRRPRSEESPRRKTSSDSHRRVQVRHNNELEQPARQSRWVERLGSSRIIQVSAHGAAAPLLNSKR